MQTTKKVNRKFSMKNIIYVIFLWVLCVLAFSVYGNDEVPESLAPWIPWVLADNEALNCPFINNTAYKEAKNHICAWPSILTIEAANEQAHFSQSWQVLRKSYILLPGDEKHWPQQVLVNNKPVTVITYQGQPAIELLAGNYLVQGVFQWPHIPESIVIPDQYPFVSMTINQQKIEFPKVEYNRLWLQESQLELAEQNALDITVARQVRDGEYIKLTTFIELNVSGKMREVPLGQLLPEGFSLIGIDSELPSFVDNDGILHVKLKPGVWEITAYAYAQPTMLSWQRPILSFVWPKDEIWVVKSHENLRSGKVEGAAMIDSSQAFMPDDWYALPSYLVSPEQVLTYQVQHRGKPLQLENQLSLNRTLWLSFDQRTFTFNDNIGGEMIDSWRLSMTMPYKLESAEDQDGSVLITSNAQEERGIENRYSNVDVQARGTISAEKQLPITGWESHFETVDLTVNLPPGNKLLAVFGVDYVSNSWWSNWTIWASFIVLLSSMIATRLFNVVAGITTGSMLLLIFQENGAPILAIFNLLLAIAVKKYQPFDKLKALTGGYWTISVALAIGGILLFSAMQMRTVIYPQLEAHNSPFNQHVVEQNIVTSVNSLKRKSSDEIYDAVERIAITGSRVKKVDSLMERYQSDALMQAGSGIPSWQWHGYQLRWHSPVAKGQNFEMIILSKHSYQLLKILGIVLSIFWLFLMLRDTFVEILAKVKPNTAASLFVILASFSYYSPNVQASDFPEQALLDELTQRLTKAPDCAPSCSSINKLTVSSEGQDITLTLVVHADNDVAFALPQSEFWRPEKLFIEGKKTNNLVKRDGWVYLPVNKGTSEVSLIGKVAAVDTFQLVFKERPKYIELAKMSAWEVVGVHANTLVGNTLEFLAVATAQENTKHASTRYTTKPFVKVTRSLSIDQTWKVTTNVERIAPNHGSISMLIPTIAGERINSADVIVDNGQVLVTLPAGEDEYAWDSMIDRQALLTLTLPANQSFIEQWRVLVSPAWHARLLGVPIILEPQEDDDYFSYLFYPYPAESLNIEISRPNAVKGDALAIDNVNYQIEQGNRTKILDLIFEYRSTRGGEHVIDLPADYQLKEVSVDSKLLHLQIESGKLTLPILPGKHTVQISMRANESPQILNSAPLINLNAPISNINTVISLSNQRWVLWTQGPLLGPSVLYWGELFTFILLALLVSRVKFSPLSTFSWIALGVGLSLNHWGILAIIAVWFAAISASQYRDKYMSINVYNFSQLGLYGLSMIAILSLLAVVPMGLLSTPNMGIEGNYSYHNHLQWFADKSTGFLSNVSVISVPTIYYKAIMLLWVIWLSFAFLNWIKWAWSILGQQGYWRTQLSSDLMTEKVDSKVK